MSFIEKLRSVFQLTRKTPAFSRLLTNISQQLEILTSELYGEPEKVASGQSGKPDSIFDYIIMDQSGGELQTEWQDDDFMTSSDIKETTGFQALNELVTKEGLSLELVEEQVDEVDDEDRVRIIVRISGWGD